jgi:transcriptional regulator with XRE-family HTH domain
MDLQINERIKKCRIEKKMSQKELGVAIGMKMNAYSRMEREGNITVEDALAIAAVLGVDPDVLIYGEKQLEFTAVEPTVLVAEDPRKNANFLNDTPQVTVNYHSGEFEINNEEKNLVTIFRNLSDEKKQELRDFLSNNY